MSHPTSAEASFSSKRDDGVLPDAPSADRSDNTGAAESDDSTDILMHFNEPTQDGSKTEIKLEDLFNDDADEDDDDEFSSSGPTTVAKLESSPPAAPL